MAIAPPSTYTCNILKEVNRSGKGFRLKRSCITASGMCEPCRSVMQVCARRKDA